MWLRTVSSENQFTSNAAQIQRAEQMKFHAMYVIGKGDLDADAVSVRVHGKANLGAKPRSEAIGDLLAAIKERRS